MHCWQAPSEIFQCVRVPRENTKTHLVDWTPCTPLLSSPRQRLSVLLHRFLAILSKTQFCIPVLILSTRQKERRRKLTWNDITTVWAESWSPHSQPRQKLITSKRSNYMELTKAACRSWENKLCLHNAFFTNWSDSRAIITMALSRLLKNFEGP